jgi:hypothetical protein
VSSASRAHPTARGTIKLSVNSEVRVFVRITASGKWVSGLRT